MAGATQVNPTMTNEGRSYTGTSLTGLTIDYATNGTDFSSTEMGPGGAHLQVIDLISQHASIVLHSGLRSDGSNDGQVWDCWVRGMLCVLSALGFLGRFTPCSLTSALL